jgi:hypothetical protein
MKWQRLAVVLSILNAAILIRSVAFDRPVIASEVPATMTVKALELIDDHGRVRAELKVFPALPDVKMPDGTVGYPESVMLRLIDSKGGPNVKLAASEDGSGLVLGGESQSYTQLLSRGGTPFIKVVSKGGREQILTH